MIFIFRIFLFLLCEKKGWAKHNDTFFLWTKNTIWNRMKQKKKVYCMLEDEQEGTVIE